MTLWTLWRRELRGRAGSFLLATASVAVAAAVYTGGVTLLRIHDRRTEQRLAEKEAQTREAMAHLENDTRTIMKAMGYNVMILHRDQDLAELRRVGHPTTFLPDDYADRLAHAGIETLNHLLPVLQQWVIWPETGERILLTGVRGQVPITGAQSRGDRSPIMAPIPPRSVALGRLVAERVRAAAGETVVLMGDSFHVERVERSRGTSDDLAVWVALDKAQQWLGQPGRINAILALECVCHSESLGQISAEIGRILPDVQVFEFSSMAKGRAEVRQRAAEAARAAIAAEKAQRFRLRAERERLFAWAVPLTSVWAALWVLILSFSNVRARRSEIGLLRAFGLQWARVLLFFLAKAAWIGLLGGLLGAVAGLGAAMPAAGEGWSWLLIRSVTDPGRVLLAVLAGALLSVAAGLGPALVAARQDPADILAEE